MGTTKSIILSNIAFALRQKAQNWQYMNLSMRKMEQIIQFEWFSKYYQLYKGLLQKIDNTSQNRECRQKLQHCKTHNQDQMSIHWLQLLLRNTLSKAQQPRIVSTTYSIQLVSSVVLMIFVFLFPNQRLLKLEK